MSGVGQTPAGRHPAGGVNPRGAAGQVRSHPHADGTNDTETFAGRQTGPGNGGMSADRGMSPKSREVLVRRP